MLTLAITESPMLGGGSIHSPLEPSSIGDFDFAAEFVTEPNPSDRQDDTPSEFGGRPGGIYFPAHGESVRFPQAARQHAKSWASSGPSRSL